MPGVEPGGQRRTAALGSRAACNEFFFRPAEIPPAAILLRKISTSALRPSLRMTRQGMPLNNNLPSQFLTVFVAKHP